VPVEEAEVLPPTTEAEAPEQAAAEQPADGDAGTVTEDGSAEADGTDSDARGS
jgi:hypothetical protein